jgi:hypothetical protein
MNVQSAHQKILVLVKAVLIQKKLVVLMFLAVAISKLLLISTMTFALSIVLIPLLTSQISERSGKFSTRKEMIESVNGQYQLLKTSRQEKKVCAFQ